jgi:phosphoribosylformylglycinamidine cyclo-ligase
MLDELQPKINGIIHCSGGGQTKVVKFLDKNVRVVKDNLFAPPPLFELIQRESGTGAREMHQVFNMGHRLEVYLPADQAQAVIDISRAFDIDARIVGRVEAAEKPSVRIMTNGETHDYYE